MAQNITCGSCRHAEPVKGADGFRCETITQSPGTSVAAPRINIATGKPTALHVDADFSCAHGKAKPAHKPAAKKAAKKTTEDPAADGDS